MRKSCRCLEGGQVMLMLDLLDVELEDWEWEEDGFTLARGEVSEHPYSRPVLVPKKVGPIVPGSTSDKKVSRPNAAHLFCSN